MVTTKLTRKKCCDNQMSIHTLKNKIFQFPHGNPKTNTTQITQE